MTLLLITIAVDARARYMDRTRVMKNVHARKLKERFGYYEIMSRLRALEHAQNNHELQHHKNKLKKQAAPEVQP